MKLLRALRPALRPASAWREALARQYVSQTAVRATTLHSNRYSTVLDRKPTDWPRTVEIVEKGLRVPDLPAVWKISDSEERRKVFSSFWLRDNCRCPHCVNQQTMQRNFDTFKLPQDIHIVHATADPTNIHVEWSDGHKSTYPWEFIRHYMYHNERIDTTALSLWGNEVHMNPPTVDYRSVMEEESSSGLPQLTMKLRKHGLCFVEGSPYDTPESTQKLLERIAFIRQTHYGGFYDFKPDLAMADTAYTNQALALHTDNTYFTDPAGLQAFHMLSHEPARGESRATGGESVLLDGFNAARILRRDDPAAYRVLCSVGLPWHSSGNKGIKITTDLKYPVFEELPSGALYRIRWNNDDRGVVPFGKISPESWYEAARKWHDILERPDLQYWFQLKPGNVLIFDNWRVLHGRSAFKGIRRICGGYINRDDFMSQWANTNLSEEENIHRVLG